MIKKIIKAIAKVISFVLLIPLFILYFMRLFSFASYSQLLSLVPGVFGIALRQVWYKLTLEKCGSNVYIDFLSVIFTPRARLGNNVFIGVFCTIDLADIGNDVMLASYTKVLCGSKQHGIKRLEIPMRQQQGKIERVTIGNDCWICTGAIIMADVANHSVVGAGSVVTKKFAPYDIIAGVPAKRIKSRKS